MYKLNNFINRMRKNKKKYIFNDLNKKYALQISLLCIYKIHHLKITNLFFHQQNFYTHLTIYDLDC